MFVDRFPFEKRTSRMVYHGVIVVWSLPVFPCLPFVSFLFLCSCLSCDSFCWLLFRLRFFLLFPFVFFLSCFSSCCIYILSSFCFPPARILFIRRFRFPVWFCVLERSQNEGKNEGKVHDKQLGMNLARSRQTFFPILLLLQPLPLPLRGLVVLLLQAFVLPAKHQQRRHHRDYCCC